MGLYEFIYRIKKNGSTVNFMERDNILNLLLLPVWKVPTMPPATAADLGYTPPDGGWGWAVVFGSFLSIGFSYAFPKSLTIYFKEIQEYFSISYSEIAWVSSIMLATMYAGGKCIYLEAWHSSPIYFVQIQGALIISKCRHKCPHLNFLVSKGRELNLCWDFTWVWQG